MRRLFVFILVSILSAASIFAQNYITDEDTTESFRLFSNNHAVKVSPALYTIIPEGINLHFEQGMANRNISLNFTFRYWTGYEKIDTFLGTNEVIVSIPEHIRIEVQPRYWVFKQFNGLFMGPLIGVHLTPCYLFKSSTDCVDMKIKNNNGKITGGLNVGFFLPTSNNFLVEGSVGFLSRSIEEFPNDPVIFMRYSLSMGYYW